MGRLYRGLDVLHKAVTVLLRLIRVVERQPGGQGGLGRGPMELYQIRYFLALSETLSFVRAAERCGVTSPSLTRAVQKLEHVLGGVLIRREGRLTHLTELGLLVRPMLAEVLAHADSTRAAARRFETAAPKPLRLGMARSLGPPRLAAVLAQLTGDHPEIALSLVGGEAAKLEAMLLDGSLDLALARRLRPANERLRYQRLYRERVVVVFPEQHRFRCQQGVRLVDLGGERLLLRTHCEQHALRAAQVATGDGRRFGSHFLPPDRSK
jgi:DNA-binding transcriptional LysR family regulator